MSERYLDIEGIVYSNEQVGMNINHCCDLMDYHVKNTCDTHPDRYDCPDMLIVFIPAYNEYGLIIHESRSYVKIGFCPWCGAKLPESKRDKWFEIMDRLKIEPFHDEIPEDYKSNTWYTDTN